MDRIDLVDAARQYGSAILRRSYSILRDRADAEDIAQEVMIILLQKGHQFRGAPSQLGGWIYRLTTHTCLNRLRTRRRRLTREYSSEVADWLTVQPANPLESLTSRYDLTALLDSLDELGQQVFVYLHLDGMTQEEIAETTGVSRRTIGKSVKRIEEILAAHAEVSP